MSTSQCFCVSIEILLKEVEVCDTKICVHKAITTSTVVATLHSEVTWSEVRT